MKKIALFFGAFAMLAFASCNKEEGMVNLTLEGEQYASNEKQSYQSDQVYFNSGDQIFVNGELTDLTPIDGGRKAKITAAYSSTGYDMVYGHGVSYDEETNTYSAIFDHIASATPINGRTLLTDAHRPMVMYTFNHDVDDNADEYAGHNHFMLKHACSFIAPQIRYGRWWADFMWNNTGDAVDPWPAYSSEDALPSMRLVAFEVLSNGQNLNRRIPLSGVATLETSDYDRPVMEMAISEMAQDNAIHVYVDDAEGNRGVAVRPISDDDQGNQGSTLCQIPVCPDYTNAHTATIVFHIEVTIGQETRYYVYKGTLTLNNETVRLVRGNRFALKANFYNLQGQSTTNYRNNKICRMNGEDFAWPFTIQ